MTSNSTKLPVLGSDGEIAVGLLDEWFDPIEAGLRDRVRDLIQTMMESELEAVLSRPRYARRPKADPENTGSCGVAGHRHGHRSRWLLGTFGRVEIAVPRARLDTAEGTTTEWKSTALRAYQRRTKQADSLIAGAYLAGTNTRRVRRALAAVFGGAVSKDTVSRVWRRVKADWDAWNARSLAAEPIVRLILDGTVVRVRLDRKATAIVLLVVLGVCQDGQKVLLAVKNMAGETSQAWRAVLDDLVKRGLRQPEFLIVDGGTGLEQALAALWGDVPTQRCTVHKHRNLLAHAPQRLHDEVSADYNDMIYAASPGEIEQRRRAFLRKWRLKCKAVADSLEEAGDRLFTFTRLPPSQWKSARTTNAIERLHEEFKRRIKTQTVLPSAETAAMLFWALLASGQITMRKVDGWQSLTQKLADQPIDLAAGPRILIQPETANQIPTQIATAHFRSRQPRYRAGSPDLAAAGLPPDRGAPIAASRSGLRHKLQSVGCDGGSANLEPAQSVPRRIRGRLRRRFSQSRTCAIGAAQNSTRFGDRSIGNVRGGSCCRSLSSPSRQNSLTSVSSASRTKGEMSMSYPDKSGSVSNSSIKSFERNTCFARGP
jgi:putative transposase